MKAHVAEAGSVCRNAWDNTSRKTLNQLLGEPPQAGLSHSR